ncbi:hypothetical protein [Limnofasciculus baicalensis]|uniref:Uncharacterized protein n=1 Tax=Limnofasciculus baicalensis BBK-W-15 TaxID=2699891 RepID=A0AAE3GPU1_9CYAN|nr:hypothetical protein [Limnofasciculus baicalensis]MCP2727929.1 hypothetical protein [Limnofasciculus baicalensis BBK-W-15]
MSESLDPQKQLKILQGIRRAEDKLVTDIQTALEDTSSYGDLEESQFRNLVRVADTTESTQVIKNFLLYQVGRDRKWGRGENSLAQRIISDIDRNIKATAQDIARTAKAENSFNQIWIELTRRYLGYGARYLVYKKKGQS